MKYILNMILILSLFSCQKKDSDHSSTQEQDKTVSIITDKTYVELGGELQYVEVISSSADNPILLFIHGGPAWPQTPQMRYYNSELAEYFTLVIWEQRGAGNSYKKNPEPSNLNLAQIIQDGHELTAWLKNTYHKEKIYVAGYSWGSLVGVSLVQASPEDYEAYIGIAQIINMDKGMEMSQNWLRGEATKNNDVEALKSIDSLAVLSNYEDRLDRFFKQWLLLNTYHGATYNQASEQETEKAMAMYEDYQDYDWFAVWERSSKLLQGDMFDAKVDTIESLEIPVFLLQGRHDWNIPSSLAEDWLDALEAPQKKIYWFEASGHGPLEEEPEKFNEVLVAIQQEVRHQ